jgi:hypothetical protein
MTDSTVSVGTAMYIVLEVQQNLQRYVKCDISFDLSLTFFLFCHRQRGIVRQFTLSCPWDVICQGHGRLQSRDWPSVELSFLLQKDFELPLKKNPRGIIPLKQFYA